MPGGGSRCPITAENAHRNLATIHMTGKEVYKQAVISMLNASKKALEQAGLTTDDIACVIPHQANLRIIESIARKVGVPRERLADDIVHAGNTSSASIPLALSRMVERGELKSGSPALLLGFGAGMCYAAQVITVP